MSSEKTTLKLYSPAKINLFLDVVGVRENGYHDIESILIPVSLFDLITLEPMPDGIKVSCETDPRLSSCLSLPKEAEENLVYKAASLLKRKAAAPFGVNIGLKKKIPIGGGMGGGSSNAATVLLGLNKLWDLGMSKQELAEIGSELGCDVPAFVYGTAVFASGLGEKISPLKPAGNKNAFESSRYKSWWLVLANPGFGVSTADIYKRLGTSLTSAPITYKNMVFALETGNVEAAAGALYNALERTVLKKYPLIAVFLDALKEAGALGCMVSGSGASVFALARSRDHAEAVLEKFRQGIGYPVWSCVSRTLPDGVMAAHGPLEA